MRLIGEAVSDPLIGRYMVALMDRNRANPYYPCRGWIYPLYKHRAHRPLFQPGDQGTTRRVNTDRADQLSV